MSLTLIISDSFLKEKSTFWFEFTDSNLFGRPPAQNEQLLITLNNTPTLYIVDNVMWKIENKKGLVSNTNVVSFIILVRKV